jgi:hypothetical protein
MQPLYFLNNLLKDLKFDVIEVSAHLRGTLKKAGNEARLN